MNELSKASKQPIEENKETAAEENKVLQNRVVPNLITEINSDDPRTPKKVDRREYETEFVRKLVTPDFVEEDDHDPDDPRNPHKVDRTGLKIEDITDSED